MRGGLHLFAHKQQSVGKPITTLPAPENLRIYTSAATTLQVRQDQRVLLGEPIARTQGSKSHCILSPISGTVRALRTIDTSHGASCEIRLENDFADQSHESVVALDNFLTLSAQQLRERIEQAGILGLGGAGFPAAKKLNSALHRKPLTLIINGAECEPYITCDDALMREHAGDVVLGVRALLHACNGDNAIVAIESDKPAAHAALQAAIAHCADSRIALCCVDTIYPMGDERQLITTLTRKEVPHDGIPADINVICHNVGTAAAVAMLIRTGRPLIERIVTLTGSGICEPHNFRVRFGTPIAHLIAAAGGYRESTQSQIEQLIVGGSMMGSALANDEGVIDATTNCLIAATAADLQPRGIEMPCIRCGNCSQVCPANLLPQQLLRYVRANDDTALQTLGLRDCTACGCCDYVCPSQIPLASQFIAAKLRAFSQ